MTSAPAPRPPVRGRRDARPDEALELPHERDQSLHATAEKPDPVIAQARRDLAAGQVDTDLHNTPGLDAQRREQLLRRQQQQEAAARSGRHHQPLVTEEPVKESPEEAAEQARQRAAASSESGPVIEGSRRRR